MFCSLVIQAQLDLAVCYNVQITLFFPPHDLDALANVFHFAKQHTEMLIQNIRGDPVFCKGRNIPVMENFNLAWSLVLQQCGGQNVHRLLGQEVP